MVSKTDFGLLRGFFHSETCAKTSALGDGNDDPHQSRGRGHCSPEMPMKKGVVACTGRDGSDTKQFFVVWLRRIVGQNKVTD
jgi:hypothetical protein